MGEWVRGGLPASLMIKGGCDTLLGVTQDKNPPRGALLLLSVDRCHCADMLLDFFSGALMKVLITPEETHV